MNGSTARFSIIIFEFVIAVLSASEMNKFKPGLPCHFAWSHPLFSSETGLSRRSTSCYDPYQPFKSWQGKPTTLQKRQVRHGQGPQFFNPRAGSNVERQRVYR